jgi:Raf kinase inhibitor-like YbhB/YbcL family protein
MQLSSPAFRQGQPIPRRHTCEGEEVAPALEWTGLPAGTRSLVLLFDDPHPTGLFTHWVLYDIAPAASGLKEGGTAGKEGLTGMKKPGYIGPCPPPNGPHHYVFRLIALDVPALAAGDLDRAAILGAIEGHVLGEAELMGTYERTTG